MIEYSLKVTFYAKNKTIYDKILSCKDNQQKLNIIIELYSNENELYKNEFVKKSIINIIIESNAPK